MTKRVLVTGASGFLGGNIVRALAAQPGIETVAACRRRDSLPAGFRGEVRVGDLRDPNYRRTAVQGIDVVCHAGTWAAMWNHAAVERTHFYEPARDLIDQAIDHGVKRFVQASTVAIGAVTKGAAAYDDFSPTRHTGFWPHLDYLVDLDRYMRDRSTRGTQMVTLRLGNFIGAGNRLGMLPALAPRLRTYLVPWLARGRSRLPLVADSDLADAFVRTVTADGLNDYESFNICGPEFPTLREVVTFIATETGLPQPLYSVPFAAGYVFGRAMETLEPFLTGSSPFLTRSIVYLCEDRVCPNDYARHKLGYVPQKDWRAAAREQLADLRNQGYPWPRLAQAVG